MAIFNIPKELFVGCYDPKPDQCLTISGMSPNTSAMNQKIKSLTKRSKSTKVITNVELPGFTLTKPTYGWSRSDSAWEVIDPRGFKLPISSSNLANIINCTGITEGLIQDKCVYGYEGGQAVLLPVNSEPYLEAKQNSEILDSRTRITDVKIGDEILLHDKVRGIFMGTWNVLEEPDYKFEDSKNYRSNKVWDFAREKRKSVVRLVDDLDNTLGYYIKPIIKISSVVNPSETVISIAEAQKELEDSKYEWTTTEHSALALIKSGKPSLSGRYNSKPDVIYSKKKAYEIDLVLVSNIDFQNSKTSYIIEESNGSRYLYRNRYYWNNSVQSRIDVGQVVKMEGAKITVKSEETRNLNSSSKIYKIQLKEKI